MSGRSQHVTIPAEYRFSTEEVYVRRDAQSGDLILSQSPGGWNEFFAAIDKNPFPDDYLADRATSGQQAVIEKVGARKEHAPRG